MVRKNVLGKIGVFAMAVMLAAAPVTTAGAANSGATGNNTVASGATGNNTVAPGATGNNTVTPDNTAGDNTENPGDTTGGSTQTPGNGGNTVNSGTTANETADDEGGASEEADNYVVTTAAGTSLVSTVPGIYAVSSVPGVAVTTPRNQLPGDLTVEVRNSSRGAKAAQSIEDGLAVLAASGVNAVKGPEVDVLAYVEGAKTVDLAGRITVAFGIPDDFKQAGYDYAVLLIQEGGRVSILPDTKADSACITVSTPGAGVYVLVKASAGSFDAFR